MSVSCKECEDTGVYVVFNAYDPDYREEVACEYCDASKAKSPSKE